MEVTAIWRPVVTGRWSVSAMPEISATSRATDEETVRQIARAARIVKGSPLRGLRLAPARLGSTAGRDSGVRAGRVPEWAGPCAGELFCACPEEGGAWGAGSVGVCGAPGRAGA